MKTLEICVAGALLFAGPFTYFAFLFRRSYRRYRMLYCNAKTYRLRGRPSFVALKWWWRGDTFHDI